MIWFMNLSTDLRRGRNCVFLMHVHLVFVTKYRRNVFTKTILEELCKIFRSVCKDFGAELTEFDGEKDHVYPFYFKNWNFGCAKAPGLNDHKRIHISNIEPLMIIQSRELSRCPNPILEVEWV